MECESESGEWIECVVNKNYEIQLSYPYRLRRKNDHRPVYEWIGCGKYGKGYIQCKLNGRKWLKHRIVALQFIPNPDNLPQIDHIDGCRTNNQISNLRWCSRSDNLRNRNSIKGKPFNYVEQLPDTATPLTNYNDHVIEDVFMDPSTKNLYLWNGARVRVLEPLKHIGKVCVKDTSGKCVMLDKYKLFEQEEMEEEDIA